MGAIGEHKCNCKGADPPWCAGDIYVFLGPKGGHFRRYLATPQPARCTACHRELRRRLDVSIIKHSLDGAQCPGARQRPADVVALASWLAALPA